MPLVQILDALVPHMTSSRSSKGATCCCQAGHRKCPRLFLRTESHSVGGSANSCVFRRADRCHKGGVGSITTPGMATSTSGTTTLGMTTKTGAFQGLVPAQGSTAPGGAHVAVSPGFLVPAQGSTAPGGAEHRGHSAFWQSSPPASRSMMTTSGCGLTRRMDRAGRSCCPTTGSGTRRGIADAVGHGIDGSAGYWMVLLVRHESQLHRRQHGLLECGDFVGNNTGCDWFLLVALGQRRWLWRVRSSSLSAFEQFVESDILSGPPLMESDMG